MLDGAEAIDHDNVPQVDFIQHVSAGYFEVMRIPLRAGRALSPADDDRRAPVVVVNEALARRFWPGSDPIGRRLRLAMSGAPWFTVIGVVADVRQNGLQAPPGSEIYVTHRQECETQTGVCGGHRGDDAWSVGSRGPSGPRRKMAGRH